MSSNQNSNGDQATEGDNTNNTNTNNNRNYNNRNNNRNGPQRRNTPKFKGEIDTIETLNTKAESRGNNFSRFKKDLHQHVIKNFTNSVDITPAVKDYADVNKLLHSDAPSKSTIRDKLGFEGIKPDEDEKSEDKITREAINADLKETVDGIWKG